MSKVHSVVVSIVSSSDGEVNQRVILEEFASTQEELIFKNFAIADKVVAACQEACRELAAVSKKSR